MQNRLLQIYVTACMKNVLNCTPALDYRNWLSRKVLVCGCIKENIVPY